MTEDWLQRINFFKGFFTQAEDWEAAQEYFLAKKRLHSRFLHTPGVVAGCLSNLVVSSTDNGSSIYVAPGYAVDGEGRDLFVPQPQRIEVRPQDYSPPATVYIILKYDEKKVDMRPNSANPEYSDHAFIQERPLVDITKTAPDNSEVIELARIALSENATRVRDPRTAGDPGADEIDMTHVQKAGAVRAQVRLSDLGATKMGSIRVRGSGAYGPSPQDPNVLLDRAGPDSFPFFFTSVHPVGQADISWRIESTNNNGTAEYRLYFHNPTNTSAEVRYRVYIVSEE